jgi:hypothetical protein
MWGIIKKNFIWFASYTIPLFSLLLFYNAWYGKPSLFRIVFSGGFILLFTVGAIVMSEQAEVKSRGYEFLQILPLTPREIVRGKFILTLANVLFCMILLLVYVLASYSHDIWLSGLSVVWVFGGLALVVSGVLYLGIYRFGLSAVTKIAWAVIMLFLGVPVVVDIATRGRIAPVLDLYHFIEGLPWPVWLAVFAAAVGLFVFLMGKSTRALAARLSVT